jgi:hypothetical protein
MIVTPELAPILTVILIGVALVFAIVVSGLAILLVGPRRPSALAIPAIAAFAVVVLGSSAGRVLAISFGIGHLRSPRRSQPSSLRVPSGLGSSVSIAGESAKGLHRLMLALLARTRWTGRARAIDPVRGHANRNLAHDGVVGVRRTGASLGRRG